MDIYITRIRTESGDLQIDYDALANIPQADTTLSEAGKFADAKATGDAINDAKNEIDGKLDLKANTEDVNKQLALKADKEYVDEQFKLKADASYVNTELDTKASKEYVDSEISKTVSKEYIDGQLETKANQKDMEQELETKATWKSTQRLADTLSAPYNYLVNSDFTKFVAQVGVGENHVGARFAGDRWLLRNGTIEGTLNERGDGYSGIKLNGTILQYIPEHASFVNNEYTYGVDVSFGSATIKYEDGCVHITSEGGILKNAWFYKGIYGQDEYSAVPEYKPNGFNAELAECQRYYRCIQNGSGYINSTADRANIFIPNTTFYRAPTIDDVYVSEEGLVLTCGKNVRPTQITSVTQYIPSNDIRISLEGTYPEGFNSATLYDAIIHIDISPELNLF